MTEISSNTLIATKNVTGLNSQVLKKEIPRFQFLKGSYSPFTKNTPKTQWCRNNRRESPKSLYEANINQKEIWHG